MAIAITTRLYPAGRLLPDGFSCHIAFAANPSVSFWEKTIKPPGFDGGTFIDITTQFNNKVRTFKSRSLFTLTEGNTKVGYDPRVYDDIVALINVEGAVTILWPDNQTLSFYGALRTFEADPLTEGTMPEATVAITPTNRDGSGGEITPQSVTAAGTGT